jgi:hypothetical protein
LSGSTRHPLPGASSRDAKVIEVVAKPDDDGPAGHARIGSANV